MFRERTTGLHVTALKSEVRLSDNLHMIYKSNDKVVLGITQTHSSQNGRNPIEKRWLNECIDTAVSYITPSK